MAVRRAGRRALRYRYERRLGSDGKTVRKKALGLENPALIFMGEMMAVRTWSAILVFGNAFLQRFYIEGNHVCWCEETYQDFCKIQNLYTI